MGATPPVNPTGSGGVPPVAYADGTTVIIDRIPGSYMQLGTRWQYDRAVRRGRYYPILSGGEPGEDDIGGLSLKRAIEALYAGTAIKDPDEVSGLPLAYIKAWKNGKKIDFDAVYKRGRWSIDPRTDPWANGSIDGAYEHTTVYRRWDGPPSETGLPQGRLLGVEPWLLDHQKASALDNENAPQSRQMRIAVMRMRVRTVLNVNPYFRGDNSVIHFQGVVNSNEVVLGEWTIPPNTIRFDYARVVPVSGGANSSLFLINYQFTVSPFPFMHQELIIPIPEEHPPPGVPLYDAVDQLTYPSKPFVVTGGTPTFPV